MKKIIYFATIILLFVSCQDDQNCQEKLQTGKLCPLNYAPVCGCNGKTYGNACAAEIRGIYSYRSGACN